MEQLASPAYEMLSSSRRIAERPEIDELDLNPVGVYGEELMALGLHTLMAENRQGETAPT